MKAISQDQYAAHEKEIREAISNLESWSGLSNSPSLRKLLTGLVDDELDSGGKKLNAYSVGVDIMGYRESFDPSNDSRLRVEMKRLREALDYYYDTEGRVAPLRIILRRRRYRPLFSRQDAVTQRTTVAAPAEKKIRRLPFAIGVTLIGAVFALFVSNSFATRVNVPDLVARERPEVIRVSLIASPDDAAGDHVVPMLADVMGRFSRTSVSLVHSVLDDVYPEDYRISVKPISLAGSAQDQKSFLLKVTHAQSSDFVASKLLRVREIGADSADYEEALAKVAASLLAHGGDVEADYFRRGDFTPTMECLSLLDFYMQNQSEKEFLDARGCVQRALGSGTKSPELLIAAANLHREAATDGWEDDRVQQLREGADAANEAIALNPEIAEAHYMASTIYAVSGNAIAMRRAALRAVELNPFDARILGGYGYALARLGDYEEAEIWLTQAEKLSASAPEWRTYAFFLSHLGQGNESEAISRGLSLANSINPLGLAAAAIASDLDGRPDQAARLKKSLTDRVGPTSARLRQIFTSRHYDDGLVEILTNQLAAIGG